MDALSLGSPPLQQDYLVKLAQPLVRWVLRPTIKHGSTDHGVGVVYVTHRRSRLDRAVLVECLRKHSDSQQIQTSYLLRAEGWKRRFMQLRFCKTLTAMQQQLLESRDSPQLVIPVSVLWGRAAHRHKSLLRSMLSERRGHTLALRRVLCFIFSRRDILVDFGDPIEWHRITDVNKPLEWNLRHLSMRLRKSIRGARYSALGPELVKRDYVIERIGRELKAGLDGRLTEQSSSISKSTIRSVKKMAARRSYVIIMFARKILKWYFRRCYDQVDFLKIERLHELSKTHAIIYAPNHRSQLDYLVLNYLLFEHGLATPQVAAGDNLDYPVVGPILRRLGAFYIRRSFRDDPLYETILDIYLRICLERGDNLEFFVEGGRSRTGLTLAPRFGLLSSVLENRQLGTVRPIAIVPLYISYESLPDFVSYVNELAGKPKTSESVGELVRQLKPARIRRGKILVHIAEPVKLDQFVSTQDLKAETQRLGNQLTRNINQSAVISSVNVIALALCSEFSSRVSRIKLTQNLECLLNVLMLALPDRDFVLADTNVEAIIVRCLSLGAIKQEETESGVEFSVDALWSKKLLWFRNNVLHVVAIPSLISAIVAAQTSAISQRELIGWIGFMIPFLERNLSIELTLRDPIRWVDRLERLGLIKAHDSHFRAPAVHTPELRQLRLLSSVIKPLLLRYFLVLNSLTANHQTQLTTRLLAERVNQSCLQLVQNQDLKLIGFVDKAFTKTTVETVVEEQVVAESQEGYLTANSICFEIMQRAEPIFPEEERRIVRDAILH